MPAAPAPRRRVPTRGLGRRLGVTKQAAAKHVDALERLGYLRRATDPDDARRKLLQLTDRGADSLARSARIFDELRAEWAQALGSERLAALEADLRTMTGTTPFRLDTPGWFGGG
ncbi:MarR family winged helix-turn-helix transcriptional regulator [Pseudonocardia sp. CA-142604]|uniref:MarR family winged helix-turn-helix transcriptional regulator n=1 Tax=Pseudonocardia sp. CA-142604 TaxID=3240024 RepID=UPI003D8A1A0E